jgi:hypothetical protein
MSLVCPISERKIDENTARLNALMTVAFVLVFLLTPYQWVMALVAADFLLRRIGNGRFSYISRISNMTTGVLRVRKVHINAGPKLFAANVGFMLSTLSLLLYYAHVENLSFILAGILAFFALLEGAFNVCVACYLYPLVSKYVS